MVLYEVLVEKMQEANASIIQKQGNNKRRVMWSVYCEAFLLSYFLVAISATSQKG